METSEFVIGQRWVSHSDTALGLGIVTDISGRRVTLGFPAADEERTYAIDNAPLSRIVYQQGEDGFEVSVANAGAVPLMAELLAGEGYQCFDLRCRGDKPSQRALTLREKLDARGSFQLHAGASFPWVRIAKRPN